MIVVVLIWNRFMKNNKRKSYNQHDCTISHLTCDCNSFYTLTWILFPFIQFSIKIKEVENYAKVALDITADETQEANRFNQDWQSRYIYHDFTIICRNSILWLKLKPSYNP